jgi:HEAT repeat protein
MRVADASSGGRRVIAAVDDLRVSSPRPCSPPFFTEVHSLFGLPPLPRTIDAALRDVRSARAEIRRSALVDLARLADSPQRKEICSTLGLLLAGDPEPELRALAAVAIADAGLTELVAELLEALLDRSPRVQQMALLALGEVAKPTNKDVPERIRPLLESPLPGLRYQALVAWSSLLGGEALSGLTSALADADPEVRWVAWSLIERQVVRLMSGGGGVAGCACQGVALRTLSGQGGSLLATLSRHADDPVMRIRIVSASVLFRLGDGGRLAQLLKELEAPHGVPRELRRVLTERFGQLKYEPARTFLLRHARRGWFEGTLGWPALVALAALGDKEAVSGIIEELDAGSVRRRSRALEAIRNLRLVAALGKVRILEQASSSSLGWQIAETLQALATTKDSPA